MVVDVPVCDAWTSRLDGHPKLPRAKPTISRCVGFFASYTMYMQMLFRYACIHNLYTNIYTHICLYVYVKIHLYVS